ncbi:ANTAR domain-containing response regulator [Hansschlegelia zhihuaiae]|uniref:ANTAR domain-containing protein n=1 Tax=Hansschlegelia zhihuaiae TaxID=405005 RepID=A0A4Q0MH79_9HYPH|nr:ANTAR domain-containing protein [Hansschlegelia zhihuaiae]RXF72774.1 ANTAR domain-containing protein [Hansschlegelia zhihuaiae]
MTPALLQNFRGMNATIFASREGGIDTLASVLTKLGLVVHGPALPSVEGAVRVADFAFDRDVLFIDGDLAAVLSPDRFVNGLPPAAVIGLVGVEAPSRLKALMNQGATAFLRKPVYAGAVYTTLFLGVNQFLQRKTVLDQLGEHRDRRRRRRLVIKTIVRIMELRAVDDDEAYAILRRDSMRSRLSLEDYCEQHLACRSEPTGTAPDADEPTLARR